MKVEEELKNKFGSAVKVNEPLASYTSWKVGGPADYYIAPHSVNELVEVIMLSKKFELPLFVMGNGTNLLVLDGGIRGLVVHIGAAFSYIKQGENGITAGAGMAMTALARETVKKGWRGVEFAAGIPGTLGGAVIMNAGAFGDYIGERIQAVRLVSDSGATVGLAKEELSFGYRCSNLSGRGIIFEVDLLLKKGSYHESLRLIENFLAERRRRHPEQPSAGSVFRNFPDVPAGEIIEQAGLKGMKVGGAEVSRKHANFIVNTGGATAADIMTLMEKVQKVIKEKYDLELQPEVRIIGEER
ncbi:MAG: UDP-N-acetylmuramate dehydrogenase [Bacillota bacterium]|nr:UDP-N-acetylmuramate dehydrogenase [Bacillota bacterium]